MERVARTFRFCLLWYGGVKFVVDGGDFHFLSAFELLTVGDEGMGSGILQSFGDDCGGCV